MILALDSVYTCEFFVESNLHIWRFSHDKFDHFFFTFNLINYTLWNPTNQIFIKFDEIDHLLNIDLLNFASHPFLLSMHPTLPQKKTPKRKKKAKPHTRAKTKTKPKQIKNTRQQTTKQTKAGKSHSFIWYTVWQKSDMQKLILLL